MKAMWWVALAVAALSSGQAQAAVFTRSFNVTASEFNNFFNEAAPFATLSADFAITYDDSKSGFFGAPDTFRVVTDSAVNSGTFSAVPIAGYFAPAGIVRSPRIVVGGALNGGSVSLDGTNDFYIAFYSDDVRFASVSFTTTGSRAALLSTDATVRETTVSAAAVPEPATWLMLLAGFAATGWALRRRRRSAVV